MEMKVPVGQDKITTLVPLASLTSLLCYEDPYDAPEPLKSLLGPSHTQLSIDHINNLLLGGDQTTQSHLEFMCKQVAAC